MIDGINLSTTSYKGSVTKTIIFYIPDLDSNLSSFNWLYRLIYVYLKPKKAKCRIAIILKRTNESPENIYTLSRQIWEEQTGKNFNWQPTGSEEFNAAQKNLSLLDKQFDTFIEEIPDKVKTQGSDDILTKSKNMLEEKSRLITIMQNESVKKRKGDLRGLVIVLSLWILFVIFQIIYK